MPGPPRDIPDTPTGTRPLREDSICPWQRRGHCFCAIRLPGQSRSAPAQPMWRRYAFSPVTIRLQPPCRWTPQQPRVFHQDAGTGSRVRTPALFPRCQRPVALHCIDGDDVTPDETCCRRHYRNTRAASARTNRQPSASCECRIDQLDPVPYRCPGARLQVRDAADIRRHDLVRRARLQIRQLVVTQLI